MDEYAHPQQAPPKLHDEMWAGILRNQGLVLHVLINNSEHGWLVSVGEYRKVWCMVVSGCNNKGEPQQQQQQHASDSSVPFLVWFLSSPTSAGNMMNVDSGSGSARRRRERQLRSWLRHERMTVRVELAAALHHSSFKGAGFETLEDGQLQEGSRAVLAV